jgi:signal transduction histidine kinase
VSSGPNPLADETRERLIEASRLATVGRLVASVVHQMSTPLAAIALRAESLQQPAAEPGRSVAPDKTARYLRAIGEETSRCRQLLSALRAFGGPVDPRVELVDLPELCRSAALLVHDEVVRRQLEVELVLQEPLAAVRGVRGRLGQAILALLVNALDASPPRARVRVEARAAGPDAVELAVSDEGGGLSEQAQERLFEPFASTRPPARGLGLGLMACRAVVEAHGGTLEVRSEGTGSRLVLRVPFAGPAEDAEGSDASA